MIVTLCLLAVWFVDTRQGTGGRGVKFEMVTNDVKLIETAIKFAQVLILSYLI